MSHVKAYVGANKDSLAVNDLVIPGDELIPLMRPNFLDLVIDIFMRLSTDVVVASLNREIQSLDRYRTFRRKHSVLDVILLYQPLQEIQAAGEPEDIPSIIGQHINRMFK